MAKKLNITDEELAEELKFMLPNSAPAFVQELLEKYGENTDTAFVERLAENFRPSKSKEDCDHEFVHYHIGGEGSCQSCYKNFDECGVTGDLPAGWTKSCGGEPAGVCDECYGTCENPRRCICKICFERTFHASAYED